MRGQQGANQQESDQPPTNKHSLHTSSQIKRSVSLQLQEVDLRVSVHAQVTRVHACFPPSPLAKRKVNMKFKRSTSLAGHGQLNVAAVR